jgi:transcriptional regulator with XRE-family HTH domain
VAEPWVEHLRTLRRDRGIPQTVLAAQLGVIQSTLSGWELGRWLPGVANARAWAAALGVDLPKGVLVPLRPVAQCGTDSGYNRHRWERTPICDLCRDAHNAYQSEYQRGCRRRSGVGRG